MGAAPRWWRGQRGSATVEFALTLPAVVLVLAGVLGAVRHGADSALAHDAASTAARVAMVEGAAAGERAGGAVAPGRVSVRLTTDGDWWVAVATVRVPGPLPNAVATARAVRP